MVRVGEGLGQEGSVIGGVGVAELGVFGRNLGGYGGRWRGFWPQKARGFTKSWAFWHRQECLRYLVASLGGVAAVDDQFAAGHER